MRKKERIKKALISLPSLVLQPEEADQFLDYVIDESVLKNNCRIVKMDRSEKNIQGIGFGSGRFLKPAGTFGTSDYKKEFASNTIKLVSKKARGCAVIYDDDLEDVTVESDAQYTDHIMKMIAAQVANELEEAAYIADTHSVGGFAADDIRSLWDGWRYILAHSASGQEYHNEVSGGCKLLDATADFTTAGKIVERETAAPYDQEYKYSKAIRSLPSKYKKKGGLAALRFFHNDNVEQDYLDALTARATALGDIAITGKAGENYAYGKVALVSVPAMPITLDAAGKLDAGNYCDTMLTHWANLIWGLEREIKIETERQAADEANYFFYSIRCDFKIENVNAAVLIHKLTHG
jgi:hypothetical protein